MRVHRTPVPSKKQTVVAFALVVSTLLAVGARAAHAQDVEPPRQRQGYYMSLGIYAAATQSYEKGNTLGPWAGYGTALRIGQLVTRRFSLGLGIETLATKGDGQTATASALAIEAGFALVGNLAVRGNVGVGFLQLKNPNDPTESSTRGAGGSWFGLGIAYDKFVGQKHLTGGLALTPVLEARFVPGTDTKGFIAFLGVDLTYWTGLPLNQLALPPSEAWRARKPGE